MKQGLWDSLEECHAIGKIDPNHVFRTKSAALRAIFQKLDKSVCRGCQARIFLECATVPLAGETEETEDDRQVIGL